MKENKQPIIYEKGTKNIHWGRTISSKDAVWETGQLHAKDETKPLPHTISKNQKRIQDLTLRPEIVKALKEKQVIRLLDSTWP